MKVEILFHSLISIRILFYFIIIQFKNCHFDMRLNRFQKIESFCINIWVLQNWSQVDESRSNIDFFYFKLIEILNILKRSQIVHIIVIIYQKHYAKFILNTILISQFQSYLLSTFII